MDPTPPPPPHATATAEAAPPPHLQMPRLNPNSVTYFPPDTESPKKHRQITKNQQAMANFNKFVMAIAASDPRTTLTPPQKTLIQNRFNEFFLDSHTPDHPTYAAMIISALKELNEEGGSSEESISKFIKSKYNDLPWAHSTFLKLHIWKLCESGEVDVTREKCYLLGDAITKLSPGQIASGSTTREKLKKKRNKPCPEDVIKEENQPKEDDTARTDMEIQETEGQNDVIEGKTLSKGRQIKVIEGKSKSLEQQSGVITEQDKLQKQEIKLPENHSQRAKHQSRGVKGLLSWSHIHKQQQQEQEKPQFRKLVVRLRPPIPESASVANVSESLPLDHCHEKQKEPAETVLDLAALDNMLSPTNQPCQSEQQQPAKRRRGRPPKSKPNAVENGGSLLDSSDQQQKHQGRGRPPKCKSSADQPGQRCRGRPPKLRPEADETTGLSLPLDHCHEKQNEPAETVLDLGAFINMSSHITQQCQNEQQQPAKRCRGRPPKPKPDAVENSGLILNSRDQQQKHQARGQRRRGRPPKLRPEADETIGPPKCKSPVGQLGQRRQGRPPKLRPEADENTGLSLNSSFHHDPQPQMLQEENLVVGGTTTCKSSAGRDVEIHKSSSNSCVQVGEGYERWTQEFKDGIMVSNSEEPQSQSATLVPPSDG